MLDWTRLKLNDYKFQNSKFRTIRTKFEQNTPTRNLKHQNKNRGKKKKATNQNKKKLELD